MTRSFHTLTGLANETHARTRAVVDPHDWGGAVVLARDRGASSSRVSMLSPITSQVTVEWGCGQELRQVPVRLVHRWQVLETIGRCTPSGTESMGGRY
jgi:hypothetical protein